MTFTRALLALGYQVVLYANPAARFWQPLEALGVARIDVGSTQQLLDALPAQPSLVVTQTSLFPGSLAALAQRHYLTGFAHMPLWGRKAGIFDPYHMVFGVSHHVIDSLQASGFQRVYPFPIYGTVDFDRGAVANPRILRQPMYDVDRRKFRDRLIGLAQPLVQRLQPQRAFARRPGLTLGIVSLLAPIKQFPQLFAIIAPILAAAPEIHLEVFGYGGYAYVRDMRRALRPLGNRVRFWGAQASPQLIYPQLDWLLAGLPEKEALGLNILEAQACGTPVLAVAAAPFTETVLNTVTGLLYTDPRQDGGADFRRVLEQMRQGYRPDPRCATDHLQKFAFPAFVERVASLMTAATASGGSEGFVGCQNLIHC